MNIEEFLRRVIPATANYAILSYNQTPWAKQADARWGATAFPLSDISHMASFAEWCASSGWDVYHALAGYRLAQTRKDQNRKDTAYKDGRPKLRAERKQSNVQAMKCFVVDLDVKRDGDGKNPGAVFPDRRTALAWLFGFCTTVNLPKPNLLVDSGYGFHCYWLFETPIAPMQWHPLANALKEALLRHGFVGDAGISVDSARILRPPGTMNMKGPQGTMGVLVATFDQMTQPDFQLAVIEAALQPYMLANAAQAAGGSHAMGALHMLGAKPAFMTNMPQPDTNAAAQANLPSDNYSFATIAQNCAQVALSLKDNGNGDSYPLWYRGHLTLAHFCNDGKDYVHEISKGDAKYTEADTDAAVARIANEAAKGLGAPRCSSYNDYRRGVCATCSWWGRLNSPIGLGRPDGDLPTNYRREHNRIDRLAATERKDEDGKKVFEWVPLIIGDVYGPRLEELSVGGFALAFTYALTGAEYQVRVEGSDIYQSLQSAPILERQGVPLDRKNAGPFMDFLMAWISKLRFQRAQRGDNYRPFGWCFDEDGNRTGVAIAGTLYRTDGAIEMVPGGDHKLNSLYRPHGKLDQWRKAAALFEGPAARVDLQTIFAISFGAPLVSLVGDVRGMSWHFWSQGSAVGKTTAMKIAQAIWADNRAMSTMTDTPNAVMRSLSGPRVMPRLWDEMRLQRGDEGRFNELIYSIPQGREKARMGPDTMLRETGEWETMVVFTSNQSLMDVVVDQTDGTDSGMARLLEILLAPGTLRFDASAGNLIKLTETNFGHAGREFLAYVAANFDTVQADIEKLAKALTVQWQIEAPERFYVAGCVAAIIGAKIAKQLKLFDFDLKAMHDFLRQSVLSLRHDRTGQKPTVTRGGKSDIEQVLSSFCYDNMDYRLITGLGPRGIDIKDAPRNSEIRWQILLDEGVMRINVANFREWAGDKHHKSPTQIMKDMEGQWGAKQGRRTLGANTRYRGGQVYVLDIPLSHPALQPYLDNKGVAPS